MARQRPKASEHPLPAFIMVSVTVLSILACGQFKLIKESGPRLSTDRNRATYAFTRELFASVSAEERNNHFMQMKKEYYARLTGEGKMKSGEESMVDQSTLEKRYEGDYLRRTRALPRERTILDATFTFDRHTFERLKHRAMLKGSALKIVTADADRIQRLLTSVDAALQVVEGPAAMTIYRDDALYAAPRERARVALALVVAAGSGQVNIGDAEVVIQKEPGDTAEKKIDEIIRLVDQRRMITLKGLAAGLLGTDHVLVRTIAERIKKSDDTLQGVTLPAGDLIAVIDRLHGATDLCAEGKTAQFFADLSDSLKSGAYSVAITHPAGTGYLNTGYGSPFSVRGTRSDGSPVTANFIIDAKNGSISIGTGKDEFLDNTAPLYPRTPGSGEFYINSVSTTGCVLRVSLAGGAMSDKDALFTKAYGKTLGESMPAAEVALKNIVEYPSPDYADFWSRSQSETASIEGKTISIKAAGNGQFTIGGFVNGAPSDFLFGHPNGTGANGIWSSFVTVRIDGEDTLFHENPGEPVQVIDRSKIAKTATLKDGKVSITQTVSFSEDEQFSRITFTITNNDAVPHQGGVRILMDTWAGSNDGVPFRLPYRNSAGAYQPREVITHEMEIFGIDAHYFEACEMGPQEKFIIRGDFRGAESRIPDRIILAAWGRAYRSLWDYSPDPMMPITHDSAVLIYYHPVAIAPQGTATFSYRYGLDHMRDNIEVPATVTTDNAIFLSSAGYHNRGEAAENITVEILPQDNRIIVADGTQPRQTLAVEPGMEGVVFFRLRATGLDRGESTVKFRISDSRGAKEYVRKIAITGASLVIADRQVPAASALVPIRFALFGGNLQGRVLVAVLMKRDGSIIERKRMLDDGRHDDGQAEDGVYGAVFDFTGIDEKEVLVKIFEVPDGGQ